MTWVTKTIAFSYHAAINMSACQNNFLSVMFTFGCLATLFSTIVAALAGLNKCIDACRTCDADGSTIGPNFILRNQKAKFCSKPAVIINLKPVPIQNNCFMPNPNYYLSKPDSKNVVTR